MATAATRKDPWESASKDEGNRQVFEQEFKQWCDFVRVCKEHLAQALCALRIVYRHHCIHSLCREIEIQMSQCFAVREVSGKHFQCNRASSQHQTRVDCRTSNWQVIISRRQDTIFKNLTSETAQGTLRSFGAVSSFSHQATCHSQKRSQRVCSRTRPQNTSK